MGRMLETPDRYGVDRFADLRHRFNRWERDRNFGRVRPKAERG